VKARRNKDRNPQNTIDCEAGIPDPVAYMLAVMEDTEAEPARRDGMAKAVAAYLRPKASAGRADGRDVLEAAVAGAKASLARKLGRLAETAGSEAGE
jgi:hypothetical protein